MIRFDKEGNQEFVLDVNPVEARARREVVMSWEVFVAIVRCVRTFEELRTELLMQGQWPGRRTAQKEMKKAAVAAGVTT
jgi:hypothetical protein